MYRSRGRTATNPGACLIRLAASTTRSGVSPAAGTAEHRARSSPARSLWYSARATSETSSTTARCSSDSRAARYSSRRNGARAATSPRCGTRWTLRQASTASRTNPRPSRRRPSAARSECPGSWPRGSVPRPFRESPASRTSPSGTCSSTRSLSTAITRRRWDAAANSRLTRDRVAAVIPSTTNRATVLRSAASRVMASTAAASPGPTTTAATVPGLSRIASRTQRPRTRGSPGWRVVGPRPRCASE